MVGKTLAKGLAVKLNIFKCKTKTKTKVGKGVINNLTRQECMTSKKKERKWKEEK